MEIIGKSKTGGDIVALTQDESEVLVRLQEATEGGTLETLAMHRSILMNRDMTNIFLAIEQFAMTSFAVNGLQVLIDEAKMLLSGPNETLKGR